MGDNDASTSFLLKLKNVCENETNISLVVKTYLPIVTELLNPESNDRSTLIITLDCLNTLTKKASQAELQILHDFNNKQILQALTVISRSSNYEASNELKSIA